MKPQTFGLSLFTVVLLILAAIAWLLQSGPPASYTAIIAMPQNHLVQADDLRGSGRAMLTSNLSQLIGRYARHHIRAGEKVSEESFDAMPSLTDVKVALWVPVPRTAIVSRAIDAGKTARLCAADKSIGTARTHAVFCLTSEAPTCSLVIDVDSKMLAAIPAATGVASLHAIPENTACQ
jgi:hypothetical protein